MLTSHIHCGQDMELIIVHQAAPSEQTTAKNNRRLHTYRCECGFSFDQRSD